MTYAGDRRILDADSHLMELPDFLSAHADPDTRHLLPSAVNIGELASIDGIDVDSQAGRHAHPPEVVEALVARGDALLRGPKWYGALGAFNGAERGRALDLLGFERQVVFSSIVGGALFGERRMDVVYAGLRAHNRAMADFCSADARLAGVAAIAFDEPERSSGTSGLHPSRRRPRAGPASVGRRESLPSTAFGTRCGRARTSSTTPPGKR